MKALYFFFFRRHLTGTTSILANDLAPLGTSVTPPLTRNDTRLSDTLLQPSDALRWQRIDQAMHEAAKRLQANMLHTPEDTAAIRQNASL